MVYESIVLQREHRKVQKANVLSVQNPHPICQGGGERPTAAETNFNLLKRIFFFLEGASFATEVQTFREPAKEHQGQNKKELGDTFLLSLDWQERSSGTIATCSAVLGFLFLNKSGPVGYSREIHFHNHGMAFWFGSPLPIAS